MAVDKNFVVKNGIEVNSNLIFADANTKRVGIGSTGPRFTLDVRGGIAATDGHFSGIITAQNVNVANYGILNGTGANVSGIATFTGGISANQLSVSGLSTLTHLESTNVRVSGITTLATADITTLSNYPNFTGGLSVAGIVTAAALNISGVSTLPTANIATLPNYPNFTGGISVVGVATASSFTGNLTGNVTGELAGAAVTTGAYGAHVSGVVTATEFHGDGANVTGISTLNITNYGIGLGGGGGIGANDNVNTTGIITAGAFFTTGIITAANFVGSGEGLTGVASTDNIQTATDATFLANVNISGITTLANTKISGITTATNKIEVRSDDGSEGRIDFYCEVSNAHYTRIQAAPHASYAGNATVVLPNSSGTLLLTDGSGASLTNLNGSNIASGTVDAARIPTLNQNTSGTAGGLSGTPNITVGAVVSEHINNSGVTTSTGGFVGNLTGTASNATSATSATSATTATNATNITLAAESSDTTCFPVFATAATGNQAPKTSSNLTYDSVDEILSCTDFNTTSDINLKKDIEIITNANEILNQINGVNFTWIKSNKPSVGIIAQEIEKVLPQLVHERSDTGTKTVNYNGLIGVLIEAVKELSQRVEELERR